MIIKKKINNNYDFGKLGKFSSIIYPIHLTPLWIETLNKVYNNSRDSFFLEIYDHKLIGTLLLQRIEKRATRFWSKRILVPFTNGPSDYFDLLVDNGYEKYVSEEISKWLRKNWYQWDQLIINLIPKKSKTWESLYDQFCVDGFNPQLNIGQSYYLIKTSGKWDDYFNSLNKNIKKEIQYYTNRLKRDGINYEFSIQNNNIEENLDYLIEIYRKRRIETNQTDQFTIDEKFLPFIKTIFNAYQEVGWINLSMLKTNNEIISFSLDFVQNGIFYYYMPSFNENFGKYAPGKLLLFEIIRYCFQKNDIFEFNFMRGMSEYKRSFNHEEEKFVTIIVENPNSIRNLATKLVTKVRKKN